MTLELLLVGLALGIPHTYVLKALLLEQKDSHEGPFQNLTLKVVFVEQYTSGESVPQHVQRVALWDWIRRMFRVYQIEGNEWRVDEMRPAVQLWTCPFCLSFWTSLLFSVPFTVSTELFWWFPVIHFGIAIVSLVIYEWCFGEN